jgi:hypothetical protein
MKIDDELATTRTENVETKSHREMTKGSLSSLSLRAPAHPAVREGEISSGWD